MTESTLVAAMWSAINKNERWQKFRNRLLEAGWRTLWSIGPEEDRRFELVCMQTAKGPVIFQVWADTRNPDCGFECYDGNTPREIEALFAELNVGAS